MTAASSKSVPTSIAVDPSPELRSSIHEVIAEFNGESVRPSMVSKVHRKPLLVNTTTSSTNDEEKEETESIHALLAALSFTPRESMLHKDIVCNQDQDSFSFDSPLKSPTATAGATPYRTPLEKEKERQKMTPPTVAPSFEQEDDDATPNNKEEINPSHSATTNTTTTASPQSPVHSPVRSYASSSYAAVSAYPLSLPMANDGDESSPSNNSSVKRCKKFPTVDTNIPGAGTRRSSMAYKKGAVKLPFVPIASSPSTALSKKKNQGPANFVYKQVKGVWTNGKGSQVLAPLMNLTEVAISWTAGITTGDKSLEHVDHNVVEPIVGAVDQHVLNPVLTMVGGILGWNSEPTKKATQK